MSASGGRNEILGLGDAMYWIVYCSVVVVVGNFCPWGFTDLASEILVFDRNVTSML